MATYSINDLEKLSGIKAHTIRIWEKRYNLVKPKRTLTNIRLYDDEDLKRILNVALLNHDGLKISRIAAMDEGEIAVRITSLSESPSDTAAMIENMISAMIELDDLRFEKLFSSCIRQYGFEQAIVRTIYPFFEKIGLLWLTGAIIPAHEHFATNLVRREICATITGIPHNEKPDARRFLIYLPEGELHETGLMFYHILIRNYGHHVTYLGQSVPFEDLETVQRIRPPDYVVTSISSAINVTELESYLLKLSILFRGKQIFFTAFNNFGVTRNFPVNVTKVDNAEHFKEILKGI